jgi:hypothetical protein
MCEIETCIKVIAVLLALITLIKGVIEYAHQGAQKRAERFIEMRKRLKDNKTFKEICSMLNDNDPKLLQIERQEKMDFLGFFEEIALMLNSGLIKKEVAHYMFGYYVIQCWESNNFWNTVSRDGTYWVVFKEFVKEMEKMEAKFKYNKSKYRF